MIMVLRASNTLLDIPYHSIHDSALVLAWRLYALRNKNVNYEAMPSERWLKLPPM